MSTLAVIRPDSWNVALFLHVLGAMVLVGSLVLTIVLLAAAWRGERAGPLRLAFRSLLLGAIPGYLVMRGGAEWLYVKEHLDDAPTMSWIDIGYAVADVGLLLLLIATVVSGVSARRLAAAGAAAEPGAGARALRTTVWLSAVIVLAYVVAIWAMTTKPA